MNPKTILRATLPLVAMLLLGSATPGPAEGDYVTLSAPAGIPQTDLKANVDRLFETEVGTTQAALVMQDGQIVAERYGEGITPQTRLLSRSIAKAITTVLVGLMVSDGRLALDSPVPLDIWGQPGDPRGGITLRHLLTMSSGLEHREAGDPLETSDTVRMMFTDGAQDMAAYAEHKPIASKPGTRFVYSTADTQIVSDLMTRMLTDSNMANTRRDAMAEFITGRLADPVGLGSIMPEYDIKGTLIGGAMMHMTARDYAKFGEFLRLRGKAKGRQILSPRWVSFMTRPSDRNPAYGGGLWLNREGTGNPLFPGRGPRSLFACVGHNGQYVIISPAQRLVIVRMGLSTEQQQAALRNVLAELVQIFPVN